VGHIAGLMEKRSDGQQFDDDLAGVLLRRM
jgi:hypothetical protein